MKSLEGAILILAIYLNILGLSVLEDAETSIEDMAFVLIPGGVESLLVVDQLGIMVVLFEVLFDFLFYFECILLILLMNAVYPVKSIFIAWKYFDLLQLCLLLSLLFFLIELFQLLS